MTAPDSSHADGSASRPATTAITVQKFDEATKVAVPVATGFRPDIQALRALAVMAVLFYHLWPSWMPGGFIGVDVFFVISGYLITRHLMQEIDRSGTVALRAFWARRIRRLLPAGYLVLAASLFLVIVTMPPVMWLLNLEQIRASAVYVLNWLLGLQAVDYLGSENDATTVLHYWSLAVEEQFYLVWPLLLVAGLLWRRRRLTGKRARRRVALVLGAIFAISLVASILVTPKSPEASFFATPLRAWEFAAGGLLSLALARVASLSTGARTAMAWTGWIGLILACFAIDGHSVQFPGWVALIPVAGAVLCLTAGDPVTRWAPGPLLRARVVQWLGDTSYSIYLWHWPLIIAGPWIMGRDLDFLTKVGIVALTMLLAFLTRRHVEDPVRTGRWWRVKLRRSYLFAAASAAALVAATTVGMTWLNSSWNEMAQSGLAKIHSGEPCFAVKGLLDHCAGAFDRPSNMEIAFAANDTEKDLNLCQQPRSAEEVSLCEFGDTVDPQHTIIVIGNSHALRLVPPLDLYGREHGWRVLLAAHTDCLGPVVKVSSPEVAACQAWSRDLEDTLIARGDVEVAVFGSHAQADTYLKGINPSAEDTGVVEDGVLSTFKRYAGAGTQVMVMGDVPGTRPESAPLCVARSHASVDPCSRPRAEVEVSNTLVDIVLAHPASAHYVPMADLMCDAKTCHAVIGSTVVYSDSHHMTTTFSRSLAPYLGAEVASLL